MSFIFFSHAVLIDFITVNNGIPCKGAIGIEVVVFFRAAVVYVQPASEQSFA